MVAFTNVDTLPGVTVDVADGRLRVEPPTPGTKLTILGTTTSTSLDINDPVRVTSVPLAMRALRHASGAPSELSMALAEAVESGATNLEVVKIATASGEILGSYAANDRFDALETSYDLLKLHPLDVVVIPGAHADEETLSATSPGGATRTVGFRRQLGDFLFQATTEFNACIGVLGVKPLMMTAADESWTGAPDTTGVWFDDPSLAFVREWEDHLSAETGALVDHSTETELDGHLQGSVETTPGNISATYDGWARDSAGAIAKDVNGVNVDGGSYISITAILARARNDETQNLANLFGVPENTTYQAMSAGAVGYAGLITTLPPHHATTNKAIGGYGTSRAIPSSVAQTLLQARMVSMVNRSGGFAIQSGVTAAYNGGKYTRSDYVRLATVRITHAAIDVVREKAERFLGLPITPEHVVALDAEVRSGLNKMKAPGAIQNFQMVITSTGDEQVLGELTINLTLEIGHELVKVKTFLQQQKPGDITV